MSNVLEAIRPEVEPISAVRIVKSHEALADFRSPDCAAAIWQRTSLPAFQSWIDTLDPAQLPNARVIVRPEDIRKAATEICNKFSTPDCLERNLLINDTVRLAEAFADIMDAPFLRLRYDAVTTDACRKFHIDNVKARLICTYRGPGTQYGFAKGDQQPSEAFDVTTGSPILLRGTRWPESPNAGLRHRSPPIEGTGQTRLVLVLDPITNPGDQLDQIILHRYF